MEEKKEKKIIFGLIFSISLISYISFITGYYSIDANKIIDMNYINYALNYFFVDGRIFSAIFAIIGGIAKISYKGMYVMSTIGTLIVGNITVIKIYQLIVKINKPETRIKKIILILLSYTYVFHFMMIDNIVFWENSIMTIGILLYINSAKNIILENKLGIGTIQCILAVAMYQGNINFFITTAFLFLLLNRELSKKEFLKKLTIIFAITFLAGIINVITVCIARANIDTVQSSRVNLNIINNMKYTIKHILFLLFESLDLFPHYWHFLFLMISLILIYIDSVRNNKIARFYNSILLLLIAYGSSLGLSLIYQGCIHEGNGRVFTSIGASFSMLGIYIYCNTNILENNNTKIFYTFLVSIYFIMIIINTMYITKTLKDENKQEEILSKKILENINEYETNTGNKIEKFSIRYEEKEGEKRKKIFVSPTNKSELLIKLYSPNTFKMYTGRKIERQGFEDEIKDKYFQEKEEKMLCIGSRIYIQYVY